MGGPPLRDRRAGTLSVGDVGAEVRLAGWVNRRRDHGGIIFIDLRDASGIVQVVVDPDQHPNAQAIRSEYCVAAAGRVRERPEGTVNPDLATGEVEVDVAEFSVLSPADPLPFQLDERTDIDELRRLEYRYLDLRRPRMAANLQARSAAIRAIRGTLDDLGFLEVETPTLIRSTPEGARDLLVPSRLRRGRFYALPQSPQLFKQLLMVSGVERYYQIARCYRDEDFRADRQLEFTQLDLEGAFWGRDDVLETLEAVMTAVVSALRGIELVTPFPRMTYRDAIDRFGTDKPDVRIGMEITDLSDIFAGTEFKAFAAVLEGGGQIGGINAGALGLSRAGLDGLVDETRELGAKGLVWMGVETDRSVRSPVAKFLGDEALAAVRERMGAAAGDTLLVVADDPATTSRVLGELRLRLGAPEDHDDLRFVWVVDFPVFEQAEDGTLQPVHHPFTAPVDVDELTTKPEQALARAYDLVVNGVELGSGSERIHEPDTQRRVFTALGISEVDAERRFGWFLEALRYGTPPHAGFAVGLDRLVSVLQNEPNIREVIPFPKTQSGLDPLTRSPAEVEEAQLAELGIDLLPETRAALSEERDELTAGQAERVSPPTS